MMIDTYKKLDRKDVEKYILSFAIILSVWLFSHPYMGLYHDSVLYSFQAISHLYPEPFKHDLFFAYGSQDDFTLFTPLYAWLIAHVGLETAMRLVVAVSQAVWIFASWRISAVLSKPQRPFFLLVLFAIPGAYDTVILGYGEMFATARIVAEALTLAALAAMLEKQPWLAAISILAAAAMHPLMAAAGILLLFLFWGQQSRRRLIAGAVFLGLAFLATLAILGLDGRLAVMDPTWLALAKERDSIAFVSTLKLQDWNLVILNFCLLLTGWRLAENRPQKRLFLAVYIVGILALAAAVTGDSIWHCQLLIQIQPVRAFWLVKWLAVLAFASLLWRKDVGGWIPVLMAMAWLAQDTAGGLIAMGAVLMAFFEKNDKTVSRFGWLALAIVAASWTMFRWHKHLGGLYSAWDAVRIFFYVMSAWFLCVLWLKDDRPTVGPARRSLLPYHLFSLEVMGIGLCFFLLESAPPLHNLIDDNGGYPAEFAARIPRNAVVYWQGKIVYTWFYLGRNSYYSKRQSAGIVFSRDSAVEMKRRAERLAGLGGLDSTWNFFSLPPPQNLSPAAIRSGLVRLCGDKNVDFVVLSRNFSDWRIAEWTDPSDSQKWWLYDCRKIAKRPPAKNDRRGA
jgi:hypothetical protein